MLIPGLQSRRAFGQASLTMLALWILSLAAAGPAPAQPVSARRPLTHQDYDGWRTIQGPHLSREGKFLAYALTPQEGDGELVVRNLETSREWRHPLGSRSAGAAAPAAASRRG